jgi:hypothetical protein
MNRFNQRNRRWGLVTILCAGMMLGCLAPAARAATVVVPNSLANVEGNSDNGFPFNIAAFGETSMRYQQVFAASQFSALGGPQSITAIAFRPNGTSSAFVSTLSNVQINLSTTAAAPDGLSIAFANNVGPNNTVVYGPGPLTLSSAASGSPRSFDVIIALQTAFAYDPSAGNLLLDVRNIGGGSSVQFDAVFTGGDSVSRAYTLNGNVNNTSGQLDTLALVAQFTTVAVPEPSTLTLIAAAPVLLLRRRRKP